MATAGSSNGTMRDRGSAVPLRLLWLAVLLISVLVAHGARAESAEGHLVNAVPIASAAAKSVGAEASAVDTATGSGADTATGSGAHSTASAVHSGAWLVAEESGHAEHPGHPEPHSHELCVSGQPQQGAAVALVGAKPTAGSSWRAPTQGRIASPVGACAALPPLSSTTGSVVQQV